MRIAARYSFNNGMEEVTRRYADLLPEINAAIKAVDAAQHKTKASAEKTKVGRVLYSPKSINRAFKAEFKKTSWEPVRVPCTYPTTHYLEDYKFRELNKGAFREMDFVKAKAAQ